MHIKHSPPVPLGVKDNTTFDFTLSQLIFSGEYIVGLQATKVYKQISEKSLVKTEVRQKKLLPVHIICIWFLEKVVRVLKESLASVDQTYNELVKMNQQGFNEETDVDQMKISMSNLTKTYYFN